MAHLASTVLPRYISNSLMLMIFVGAGTLGLGTLSAWLTVMCEFPGRRIFDWALILPLAVPTYVMAYAYTDFLQFSGPLQTGIRHLMDWGPGDFRLWNIRSLGGAIIVFSFVLYPYVYLIARTAFVNQSTGILEAARTLGANPRSLFWRVAVPAARPALVAGVALVLMETLADFGAVSFFGVPTFTTGIYHAWFSLGDKIAAAQLASMLLGFVFLLLIMERWSRKHSRYHDTGGKGSAAARFILKGAKGWLAHIACLLPVLFGFMLPVLVLGAMVLRLDRPIFTAKYVEQIFNTLSLGVITAVLAVVLAIMVTFGLRMHKTAIMKTSARVAGMGYAIPGSIIAVGVLIPFAALDNAVDGWFRTNMGFSTGLILTGSIAAMVFAYLVRFLSVSMQTMEAGYQRIGGAMDAAARTLGAPPGRLMWRVHLPLLKGSLLTAFLLVLVEVMKELPTTMIMRPFNFDTLAVTAHNLAADERLALAAVPALTIVLVGLIPITILSKMIARSRISGKENQGT
jgi:iron(III) transport system permease protein